MILRSRYLYLPVLLASIFLVLQCRQADSDREANRLFVEAYQFAEQGKQRENADPVAAYKKYRKALDNIEKIIQNHSGTQVAVDVTQQQTRIGEMTIAELRINLPRFEARARALDGFHELSGYLNDRIEDDVQQAEKRIRYGMWLYQSGKDSLYEEVMSRTAQQAERHWNARVTDQIYCYLSEAYSKSGMWQQSLVMANFVENPSLLYRSIETMLENGILAELDQAGMDKLLSLLNYVDSSEYIRLLQLVSEDLFSLNMRRSALSLLQSGLPSPDEERTLEHIEALNELSSFYASYGEFEASRDIIRKMDELDEEYAGFALRNLAIELARRRNMKQAREIVDSFDREYFEQTTIAAISVQHARNGRVTEALSMLDHIPERMSEKMESKVEIAYLLSDYGDHERADSLLKASRTFMEDIGSALVRAETRIRIAEIFSLRNERSAAAEALEEAEDDARTISGPENQNLVLTRIFLKWTELGRPDRALDLAAWFRMDHASFPDQVNVLLEGALKHGYHDLARSVVVMTDREHYYRYLLNTMYLDQNNLDQSRRLAYEIRNFYWRTKSLADLSLGLKRNRENTSAEKAATDALQTMQRIRDSDEMEKALYYVSSRFSAAGIIMNDNRKTLVTDLVGQLPL